MIINIVGQALICMRYIIFWVSCYMKTKKYMLVYDNISKFFVIAGFLCLGTYDGIKNTLFSFVRNIIGNKVTEKPKKSKLAIFIVMSIVLFLIYLTNISKISTICVFICGIFNLYGVVVCREQGIRICGLLGSGFYAMFLHLTGNYIGLICELVCAIVKFMSYCKYRKEADVLRFNSVG